MIVARQWHQMYRSAVEYLDAYKCHSHECGDMECGLGAAKAAGTFISRGNDSSKAWYRDPKRNSRVVFAGMAAEAAAEKQEMQWQAKTARFAELSEGGGQMQQILVC